MGFRYTDTRDELFSDGYLHLCSIAAMKPRRQVKLQLQLRKHPNNLRFTVSITLNL